MAPLLLYSIVLIGAVGLFLALRPGPFSVRSAGGILGLGAMAFLGIQVARVAGGMESDSPVLYGLFALIALYGAGQMVTNKRPVYAALYFVLVVIASAAMFLLMQAEFMAFALVIVYAGAILITYMFVLMLAQQANDEDDVRTLAIYDRSPREPATAVAIGFIMLAVLCDALFGRGTSVTNPSMATMEAQERTWRLLETMPPRLRDAVEEVAPGHREMLVVDDELGHFLLVEDGRASVQIIDADGAEQVVELRPWARPGNTAEVGMALVAEYPASLEVAGVILTMAMFGAVVLARRQIELGEDQRREAAGLRPLDDVDQTTEGGAA